MLHIIFLILKILGFVLLAVFGIVILLLAALILLPAHYKAALSWNGTAESLKWRVKFHWLIHLISGEAVRKRKFEVVRKADIVSLSTDRSGAVFHVLSPSSMAEDLELYRMEIAPGCIHRSQAHAKGTEEFLNLLEGRVKVSAGEDSAILEKGDFIMFQSDVNHTIENLSETKVDLFMVVRFARNEQR